MKKILSTIAAICFLTTAAADSVPFGNGQLSFTPIARNAVRIQYQEGEVKQELPEWIYVNNIPVKEADVKVDIDPQQQKLSVVRARPLWHSVPLRTNVCSDSASFRTAFRMCVASRDASPR